MGYPGSGKQGGLREKGWRDPGSYHFDPDPEGKINNLKKNSNKSFTTVTSYDKYLDIDE